MTQPGKRTFAGNGLANSVKTIAGVAPLRVYLGAGSGVQLEINDRAVAIGPQFFSGDVARFEAGADGVLRRDSRPDQSRGAPHAQPPPARLRGLLSKIIEPLRGVHDVLPAQIAAWQHLERITRQVFAGYGYEEFRVPVIEQTQLFKRSIGDFTDIVEKEMFSFVDQGEDQITLRPEATAGIVRAVISNGLLREGRLRVWCMGPMFRRERPQAGRFRQFHQIDAEAFGFEGPDVDAEIILLSARLLRLLGLGGVKLQLNSLGTPASRAAYRDKLTAYFSGHAASLDEDSQPPLERQSAANTRQQESANAAQSLPVRRCCWNRSMRSPGATSNRSARAYAAPASSIMSSRIWCAGWTTTPARCSNGPPTRWARKVRSAPAAATMDWWPN